MSPAGEAPLARTGWSASADATEWGDWPDRALDGDPSTRWSTGREQTVGQAFTVDRDTPVELAVPALDADVLERPRPTQPRHRGPSTYGSVVNHGQANIGEIQVVIAEN